MNPAQRLRKLLHRVCEVNDVPAATVKCLPYLYGGAVGSDPAHNNAVNTAITRLVMQKDMMPDHVPNFEKLSTVAGNDNDAAFHCTSFLLAMRHGYAAQADASFREKRDDPATIKHVQFFVTHRKQLDPWLKASSSYCNALHLTWPSHKVSLAMRVLFTSLADALRLSIPGPELKDRNQRMMRLVRTTLWYIDGRMYFDPTAGRSTTGKELSTDEFLAKLQSQNTELSAEAAEKPLRVPLWEIPHLIDLTGRAYAGNRRALYPFAAHGGGPETGSTQVLLHRLTAAAAANADKFSVQEAFQMLRALYYAHFQSERLVIGFKRHIIEACTELNRYWVATLPDGSSNPDFISQLHDRGKNAVALTNFLLKTYQNLRVPLPPDMDEALARLIRFIGNLPEDPQAPVPVASPKLAVELSIDRLNGVMTFLFSMHCSVYPETNDGSADLAVLADRPGDDGVGEINKSQICVAPKLGAVLLQITEGLIGDAVGRSRYLPRGFNIAPLCRGLAVCALAPNPTQPSQAVIDGVLHVLLRKLGDLCQKYKKDFGDWSSVVGMRKFTDISRRDMRELFSGWRAGMAYESGIFDKYQQRLLEAAEARVFQKELHPVHFCFLVEAIRPITSCPTWHCVERVLIHTATTLLDKSQVHIRQLLSCVISVGRSIPIDQKYISTFKAETDQSHQQMREYCRRLGLRFELALNVSSRRFSQVVLSMRRILQIYDRNPKPPQFVLDAPLQRAQTGQCVPLAPNPLPADDSGSLYYQVIVPFIGFLTRIRHWDLEDEYCQRIAAKAFQDLPLDDGAGLILWKYFRACSVGDGPSVKMDKIREGLIDPETLKYQKLSHGEEARGIVEVPFKNSDPLAPDEDLLL